jgi:hypothetical protein
MEMKKDRKKTQKGIETVAIVITKCYCAYFEAYYRRLKVLVKRNHGLQEV